MEVVFAIRQCIESNFSEQDKYLRPKYDQRESLKVFHRERTWELLHNLKRSLEITKLRFCNQFRNSLPTIYIYNLESRKPNEHARVLTRLQALKNWRDFRRSSEQKRLRTLYPL